VPAEPRARVVVSGIGIVTAAGFGIGPTWVRLRNDPPQPTLYGVRGVRFPVYEAAPYGLEELGLAAGCLRWLADEGVSEARDLRHMVASSALALIDAGLGVDLSRSDDSASVVVANESPGFEELSSALLDLDAADLSAGLVQRYSQLEQRFFRLNTFLLPYYLARAFRIAGPGLYVNSACTSGLHALELAAEEVRARRSRVALAVASENPLSLAKFLWFQRKGLYALNGRLQPFDRGQSGTVFGDGGAALLLENRDDAHRRGARIYAEYLGAGFAQDGWKVSVPSPVRARAAIAIRRALDSAKLDVSSVDLLVPHGVATPASDQYESAILNSVFDDVDHWPMVTALKPLVGHNLGGSALVESALLLNAIARGQVPPTLSGDRPYDRHPLPLVREWKDQAVSVAMKLTCGFAGHYGAAVFRRDRDGD
jgi:3-oxoacyl-[acyl-carrier-protein] synthase II